MAKSSKQNADVPMVVGKTVLDLKSLPELFDKVEYKYANYVRVASSKSDVRIAFGDLDPSGGLRPQFGVVMSQLMADRLIEALQTAREKEGEDNKPPKSATSR